MVRVVVGVRVRVRVRVNDRCGCHSTSNSIFNGMRCEASQPGGGERRRQGGGMQAVFLESETDGVRIGQHAF
jgi:hypothetical protein